MERSYVIPLRREWLKTPKYKRAKKAATASREFLEKHMKSSDVRLGKSLNEELWKHGMKNPPGRIAVTAVKDKDGVVRAELKGVKVEVPVVEKKEKKSESVEKKVVDAEVVKKEVVPEKKSVDVVMK